MIDIKLNSHDASFEYFSTGKVIKHDLGEPTCTVQRTEGGILKQVPILGMYGAGGQATSINHTGSLVDCYVAIIKIQGIYCILGTIPNFSDVSSKNRVFYSADLLPKEDA